MRPDDKMIKELMSEIEAYTNGIGAVLFPIGNKDLPTAVYAMRTTLKALESEMTEDQKKVVFAMECLFCAEKTVIQVPKGTAEKLKTWEDMA